MHFFNFFFFIISPIYSLRHSEPGQITVWSRSPIREFVFNRKESFLIRKLWYFPWKSFWSAVIQDLNSALAVPMSCGRGQFCGCVNQVSQTVGPFVGNLWKRWEMVGTEFTLIWAGVSQQDFDSLTVRPRCKTFVE